MRTGPIARTTAERRGNARMASAASALTALTSHRPTAEVLPRVLPLAPVPPPSPIPAPAPYLTTADAARYCGFKTPSAIRKAHMEGRSSPSPAAAARAPGSTPSPISTDSCGESRRSRALLPFRSRNAQVRLPQEEQMSKQEKWKLFKGSWISEEPVLPRVWERREGGHVVRARILDRTTGRQREIWKVLPDTDAPTALKWIEDECNRVRSGVTSVEPQKMRFCDYATSLLERKLATGEIRAASGRERWRHTLTHLIGGTESVAGFGDIFIEHLRPMHVEAWRAGIGQLIASGRYSPSTANGWLNILRHVMKRAKRELQLSRRRGRRHPPVRHLRARDVLGGGAERADERGGRRLPRVHEGPGSGPVRDGLPRLRDRVCGLLPCDRFADAGRRLTSSGTKASSSFGDRTRSAKSS